MIPQPEFFRHYFEYVMWADNRQFAAVQSLPEAEVYRERGFSFGSIQKTLLHELAAQSVWLDRFEGVPPAWLMNDESLQALPELARRWPAVHARGRKFMAGLTTAGLEGPLTYTNVFGETMTVPRWEAIFHMCQHALHHRGQINSMITLAGGKPVAVDYSRWIVERGTP